MQRVENDHQPFNRGFVGNFQGVLSIKNDWTLEFGVEFGPQRAVLFSSVDWFLTDVYLPQKDIAVRCLRLGLVSLRHQDVLWK